MIEKIKQAIRESDMLSQRDKGIVLDIITNIQIEEIQKEIDKMNKRLWGNENYSSRQ